MKRLKSGKYHIRGNADDNNVVTSFSIISEDKTEVMTVPTFKEAVLMIDSDFDVDVVWSKLNEDQET